MNDDDLRAFALTKDARDGIDDNDFAGPNRSFPCDTVAHLKAACTLYGKADDPAAVKAAIIRIAKRRGGDFLSALPEAWNVPDGDGDADDTPKGAAERHPMVSADATKRTQQIHDHAVAMGATCTAPTVSNQPYYVMPGAMMGERGAMDGAPYHTMAYELPKWFTDADAPPQWVPYLPTPNLWAHESYGEVNLTADRNLNFVNNFNAGVYQKPIPLDGEHADWSGAFAWVYEMRQNDDGSVDAKVEWTPRGEKQYRDKSYKFISPAWLDTWKDRASGEVFQDVAVGGALTTRPFFKPKYLRPLAANEMASHLRPLAASEDSSDQPGAGEGGSMTATTETVSPVQFSELQQQFAELQGTVRTLTEERDAAKQAAETVATENTTLTERVAAMEQKDRIHRFTEEVRHWTGDPQANVTRLEKLAARFGEDSDDFREECRDRRAFAEQQRQTRAVGGTLFGTIGSDLRQDGGGTDAQSRLNAMAEARAKEKGITTARAMTELLQDPANADLYQEATASA